MNRAHRITTLIAAAGICAALLTSAPISSQTRGESQAISPARAENIARNFELQAGRITILDRQGKVITQVGPRALYGATVFSPDRKRIAAVKIDLEQENRDIWVFDLDSGAATRISTSARRE